jgi:hypothetical protein
LIATNIEEVGAGSVLWCEAEFSETAAGGKYSVSGHCLADLPRASTEEQFHLESDQSISVSEACRISGNLTIRQGSTTFNVVILHGRVEGAGRSKSRALMVSRWPRGNKSALQTMVMQR